MYKVKILSVGKTKEDWLEEALSEYEKRMDRRLKVEWVFAKHDEQLEALLAKEERFFALTPEGTQYTSKDFSAAFISWLISCGSRLTFVIGGAEGIAKPILLRAKGLLSLSSMTFTHQMTRLILMEQIYRALEIDAGSRYHK